MIRSAIPGLFLLCLVSWMSATSISAGPFKPKTIKSKSNPAQYAKFSSLLPEADQRRHALSRLTFGAKPGDMEHLKKVGLKKWVGEQLHPELIPEDPLLARRLSELSSLFLSAHDTYSRYAPNAKRAKEDAHPPPDVKLSELLSADQIKSLESGTADEQREVLESIPSDRGMDFARVLPRGERRRLLPLAPVALRRNLLVTTNPQNVVASDLSEGKLLRAIYSRRQLTELLDDFWFNHFNVFENKGADRYLLPTYEREAIQPHVFGKFYDLLLATAESPAMLFYLDNWQSVASNSASPGKPGKKIKRGLNENYGRELLELHTLGVNGGYTQKDVVEVARCFTGWTITNPRKVGAFEYNDRVHDKGQKVVLGHVIPAGGAMNDGLKVLDILSHHPSTAHFISLKLAQRFVADDPPPSLVERMSRKFLKSGGDLRQVMQTMLLSPEFWSAGAFQAKVKTPFEMVVSSVRATNADVTSAFVLGEETKKLGQPLYRKIEPTGYPSANAEWVSSAALLERMNFSSRLANNRVPGATIDYRTLQPQSGDQPWGHALDLAATLLGSYPGPQTEAAMKRALPSQAPPSLIAALALGSPEFQRH